MKKLKLIGLSNNDERSTFIFDKGQIQLFFNLFLVFFEKTNLLKTNFFYDESHLRKNIYEETYILDKKYEGIDHVKNEIYDVDLVFLSKKIILIVRCNKQIYPKLKEIIFSISEFNNENDTKY
ncbi:hypothetical protein HQ489_04930 [Candidatus Woesearchaeota archaeon]|nr:hypothetical protein [Candidatus Woesearchaeota archaeon]